MHIVVLRDPDTGEVTKAFNVEDDQRAINYLDEGSPDLEVYELVSASRPAPLTMRRKRVNETSRVTESRTVSAELESV